MLINGLVPRTTEKPALASATTTTTPGNANTLTNFNEVIRPCHAPWALGLLIMPPSAPPREGTRPTRGLFFGDM